MVENGDNVLKVVQLFIDNINESTKSTAKELDKLGVQVETVKSRINTPPRHEELSAQIQNAESKIDTVSVSLTTIDNSIRTMIISVRVAAAVMAFAVLLAAGIIQYGKYVDNKNLNSAVEKIENCLEKITKDNN